MHHEDQHGQLLVPARPLARHMHELCCPVRPYPDLSGSVMDSSTKDEHGNQGRVTTVT